MTGSARQQELLVKGPPRPSEELAVNTPKICVRSGTVFLDSRTADESWRKYLDNSRFNEVYVTVREDRMPEDVAFVGRVLQHLRRQQKPGDMVVIGPIKPAVAGHWGEEIEDAGLRVMDVDALTYQERLPPHGVIRKPAAAKGRGRSR